MALHKCIGLWGEAHIMYGDPPVREVPNAIFIPFNPAGSWGVYDSLREPIIESVDLRGGERIPHVKNLAWSANNRVQSVAYTAPLIYGGWPNPHFGHFLINSLPRFWPLWKDNPSAKILCAAHFSSMPHHAQCIFRRLGLDAGNFICFDEPTTIKNLIVPSPCLLEQHWIYTVYRDLCLRISAGLWRPDEVDLIARPAYLSKARLSSGVGRFAGEVEIENVMRLSGIDIFYPEMLTFEEQVRLFTTRRLCIGPTGSAFHTAIFAAPGRKTICFNPAKEVNSNFILVDQLCSNEARYFYQEGMTYKSGADNFITTVQANNEELAYDLVKMARETISWN